MNVCARLGVQLGLLSYNAAGMDQYTTHTSWSCEEQHGLIDVISSGIYLLLTNIPVYELP